MLVSVTCRYSKKDEMRFKSCVHGRICRASHTESEKKWGRASPWNLPSRPVCMEQIAWKEHGEEEQTQQLLPSGREKLSQYHRMLYHLSINLIRAQIPSYFCATRAGAGLRPQGRLEACRWTENQMAASTLQGLHKAVNWLQATSWGHLNYRKSK